MKAPLLDIPNNRISIREFLDLISPSGGWDVRSHREAEADVGNLSSDWAREIDNNLNTVVNHPGSPLSAHKINMLIKKKWPGGVQEYNKLNPLIKGAIHGASRIPGKVFATTISRGVDKARSGVGRVATWLFKNQIPVAVPAPAPAYRGDRTTGVSRSTSRRLGRP